MKLETLYLVTIQIEPFVLGNNSNWSLCTRGNNSNWTLWTKVCLSEFATFDIFMLNLGIVPHISKIFDLYHRNLALADDI